MITKYAIPIAAALLTVFAVVFVITSSRKPPPASPPVPPPRTPYANTVAGAGIIESESENISIGSPVEGIVVEVMVAEGDDVTRGDPLFRLDDRSRRADLQVQEAALASTRAELEKLKHEPRPEDVPVSTALVDQAEATLSQKEEHLARMRKLVKRQAATEDDLETSQRDEQVAKAELAQAKSKLALLKAGAWNYDIGIAEASVNRAAAAVAQIKTELDILFVRASVDGEVLQVNVRPGEFVTTFGQQSDIVLGNTQDLHVRVDIDE